MSRRLTTTIGHRVVHVEKVTTKRRPGHFVTLAIIAAIGIAAGAVLLKTISGNTAGVPEAVAVEKRHVVSTVAGTVAGYPLPGKPDLATEAAVGAGKRPSALLNSAPQQTAKPYLSGANKEPQLTDTAIVTSAVNYLQASGASQSPQPASERFGGEVLAGKAGKTQMQVGKAGNSNTGLDARKSGLGVSVHGMVDVAETENAALAVERKLAALGSEQFEPVADPVTPAPVAEAKVRLGKGRVKKYANLRSGPNNDAPVLAVVPPNAQVQVQRNCVHWCRAVYKDRKGYIYRALIRRPGKTSKTAQASARTPAKTVTQKHMGKIGR